MNRGTVVEIIEEKDRIEGPRAWVNLKNTNICLDLHCECGTVSHYDGYFAHYLRCAHCERIYALGSNLRTFTLTEQQEHEAVQVTGVYNTVLDEEDR